jgi:hypothetical protein
VNTLIIGGLLALALVALVSAILLGIGEERAEKQRAAEKAASLARASKVAAAFPSPTGDLRTTRQLAPSPHENDHHSTYSSVPLSAPNAREEEAIAFLKGQFHSITGDLRSLGKKVSELERRLNVLSEVFESLPHPLDERTTNTPLPSMGARE